MKNCLILLIAIALVCLPTACSNSQSTEVGQTISVDQTKSASTASTSLATATGEVTALATCTPLGQHGTPGEPGLQTYSSQVFGITFEYPDNWRPTPGYEERYGGPDGFFSVSTCCHGLSMDAVADLEAHHKLQPYGSTPAIETLTIQGQEARLIMPSADQRQDLERRAALLVRYPVPVTIQGESYEYLVLLADRGHIRGIASTLRFR